METNIEKVKRLTVELINIKREIAALKFNHDINKKRQGGSIDGIDTAINDLCQLEEQIKRP